jgi:hypothetical protein
LNSVGYRYQLLTLVFSIPGAHQTAELDERLGRIEHLGDAETDITGGGLLGLSYNARRAIISRRSLLSRRGMILRLQRQGEAGL